MSHSTSSPSPSTLFLILLRLVHWVTKIIYHSCYFSSLSNCLLFKQKGYLNCYVAPLFMPWHKNACLLLHAKVTHYNLNNFFSVGGGYSKCLLAATQREMESGLSESNQAPEVCWSCPSSDNMNLFTLDLSLPWSPLSFLVLYLQEIGEHRTYCLADSKIKGRYNWRYSIYL